MGSGAVSLRCECGHTFEFSARLEQGSTPCPACKRSVSTRTAAVVSDVDPDAALAELLLEKGWVTLDQMDAAQKRQEEAGKKGRRLRLSAILLEMGALTPDQLKEALAAQGKTPMRCPSCSKILHVRGYRAGTRALCPSCRTALVPTGSTSTRPGQESPAGIARRLPTGDAVTAEMAELIPGYRIERRLGSGGMGDVYLARQLSLDRSVAIKLLPPELAQDASYVQRFLSEARAAAKVAHEHIVAAVDAGESKGRYYFVMEYVEGETLHSILKREGSLPEKRALELGKQVARGLEKAREYGLVHRDIKPANIMIARDGRAKILDFGLAREITADVTATQAGNVHSSPAYASPEQCRAEADLDHRSDMYSLGVTLFEALTGRLPFEAEAPRALFIKHVTETPPPPRNFNPGLSAAANNLVLRLLRKQREGRFKDYEELIQAIDTVLQPAAAGARLAAPAGAGKPRTMMWVLSGIAGAVLLGIVLLALPREKRPAAPPPPPEAQRLDPEVDRLLKEARRLQREADGKSSEYPSILERWKALERHYRGTAHHPLFAAGLVEFQTKLTAEAEAVANQLLAEAQGRIGRGQPAEALLNLRKFPAGFSGTDPSRRIAEKAADVERMIGDRFKDGKQAVADALTGEKFDQARRLLQSLHALVSANGQYVQPLWQGELDALARAISEEEVVARRRAAEATAAAAPPKAPPTPPATPKPPEDPKPVLAPPPPLVPTPVRKPPPAPEPKRLPEPDAAALKAGERELRELFKEDYAKKAAPERRALARKLFDLGNQTKDDVKARYVLYREAQDLAVQGGDLDLAARAVDEMARHYAVNGRALKNGLVAAMAKSARAPEEFKSLTAELLVLADEAVAAEDFDTADKAAVQAAQLARRSKEIPLVSRADGRAKEIAELKAMADRARRARETLAAQPQDPGAHVTLGRYLCFAKKDWDEGLPHLAQGADAQFKAQAQRDLARPTAAPEQLAVGDGWWDLGEKETGETREACRERAAAWYEPARAGLTGLQRSRVEKRLSEAVPRVGLGASAKLQELDASGFVQHWLIAGPFPNPGDRGLDIDYLGGESGYVPSDGKEVTYGAGVKVKWGAHVAPSERIDFFAVGHLGLFANQENFVVYSACWLECEADATVEIRVGSDDGCAVWVDQKEVGRHHLHRAALPDQETYPVRLTKGRHLVLIKVDNGARGCEMLMRVTTPGGGPAQGIRVSN